MVRTAIQVPKLARNIRSNANVTGSGLEAGRLRISKPNDGPTESDIGVLHTIGRGAGNRNGGSKGPVCPASNFSADPLGRAGEEREVRLIAALEDEVARQGIAHSGAGPGEQRDRSPPEQLRPSKSTSRNSRRGSNKSKVLEHVERSRRRSSKGGNVVPGSLSRRQTSRGAGHSAAESGGAADKNDRLGVE